MGEPVTAAGQSPPVGLLQAVVRGLCTSRPARIPVAPSAHPAASGAASSEVEQLDLFTLLTSPPVATPRVATLGTHPARSRPTVTPRPSSRSAWPFADARPLAVEAVGEAETSGALTASVFDAYRPSVRVPGAQPHPTKLVESAAMAAATAPPCTYRPTLPEHIVTGGHLSDAQLETVIRAGSAHTEHLPGEAGASGARQGFFVGDGTGVGKA